MAPGRRAPEGGGLLQQCRQPAAEWRWRWRRGAPGTHTGRGAQSRVVQSRCKHTTAARGLLWARVRGARAAVGYGWRCRVWSLPVKRLEKEGDGRRGATLIRQVTPSTTASNRAVGWSGGGHPLGGARCWGSQHDDDRAVRSCTNALLWAPTRNELTLREEEETRGAEGRGGGRLFHRGVSHSRPVTTTVFPRA